MQRKTNLLRRTNISAFESQNFAVTSRGRLTSVGGRQATDSFTIAHIADPHINMDRHPERLAHLRELLIRAIHDGTSHIVISGDIASVPEVHHWEAVRTILQELGIYHRSMVSIVIGNHDVFGGPHTASELLRFQRTCRKTDVERSIRLFESVFAELFRGTLHPSDSVFPYVKVVGSHVFIGVNTIAPFSLKHNPCASNGEVPERDIEWINNQMERLSGYRKIVIMHHHLLNQKAAFLKRGRPFHRMLYWLEDKTLKLRNQSTLIALFRKHGVEAVLHGHVHVSTGYDVQGIACSNAGGSVMRILGSPRTSYNHLKHQAGRYNVTVK